MITLFKRTATALVLAAGTLAATSAAAVPISFVGDLTGGATNTVTTGMDAYDYSDTTTWATGNLWTLSVNAGDTVTVTALRTSDIDPYMAIWDGLETDTSAYSQAFLNSANTSLVANGDDELLANFASTIACCGDPQISFTAATTGVYTVGIFGLGGDASSSHGYIVQAIGATGDPISAVPLPAALPLLMVGLGGLGLVSRRRRDA